MDILSMIERLQEKRRSDKITPDHVPEVELMNAIQTEARKEIDALCASGRVGITETINSKAIYIKPK